MDENTQQAQTPEQQVPESTQEVAMPTTEQTTPQGDGLPESASDRTKHEFEKLRSELREERTRRELLESNFKTLSQPKETAPEPIFNPDTGFVDERVLTDTQRRAIEAEKAAISATEELKQFRQEQEAREAFQSHPELNPDGKEFDKELHVAARRVILDSMLNPQDYGGKQLSLKEAGDLLKKVPPAVEEARKEGAQEAIEQLTPKEQAALDATGTSGRRSDLGQNHDTLVQRSRKGDFDAIAERMNRITSKE